MRSMQPVFRAAGWAFRKNRPILPDPRRILVYRQGGLGDVINTTPLLHALRRRFPEARIDYLVGDWSKAAILHDPCLHTVHSYPDAVVFDRRLDGLARLVRRVRGERYDMLLNGNKSWMYNVLGFAFGIPIRIGFDRYGEGFCNTHNVPYDDREIHEIDAYLGLFRFVSAEPADDRVRMVPGPQERIHAEAHLRGLNLNRSPIVCIGPGGSSNPGDTRTLRRFPESKYAALARALVTDCNILLIGGRQDAELHDRIALQALRDVDARGNRIISVAGELNVREVCVLMERCALYIGHSSGQTHIADASGIPILFLNGPVPTNRFAPKRAVRIVSHQPCYDVFGVYRVPEGFEYYDDVDVEDVAATARRMLETGRSAQAAGPGGTHGTSGR